MGMNPRCCDFERTVTGLFFVSRALVLVLNSKLEREENDMIGEIELAAIKAKEELFAAHAKK
ncbi:MAG: hypothetical protein IJ233_10060, partial [Pyramidobacter sp.]|nr:hypothetical protein [Pyramidobacter sp.]